MKQRVLYKRGRRTICYMDIYDNKVSVHLGKPSDNTGFRWLYDKSDMAAAMQTVDDLLNFRLTTCR